MCISVFECRLVVVMKFGSKLIFVFLCIVIVSDVVMLVVIDGLMFIVCVFVLFYSV